MEIGPINGIRMIPAVKAPPADTPLTAVFDIATTARAGDETYSGGGKSAGGQDDEDAVSLDDAALDSAAPSGEDAPPTSVNFFA
ncbi:MAG: hypothetical protein ACRD3N_19295 [Terracidiphilus sp.]